MNENRNIIDLVIRPYQKYKTNTRIPVNAKKIVRHIHNKQSPLQLTPILSR